MVVGLIIIHVGLYLKVFHETPDFQGSICNLKTNHFEEIPLGLNFCVPGILESFEVELFVGGVLVDDEQVFLLAGNDEPQVEL